MNLTWNVAPRYTAGSPAMVDTETARRVAIQEKEAIQGHLDGFFGDEAREKAQRLGLAGIVWSTLETHRMLRTTDLITGESKNEPIR